LAVGIDGRFESSGEQRGVVVAERVAERLRRFIGAAAGQGCCEAGDAVQA